MAANQLHGRAVEPLRWRVAGRKWGPNPKHPEPALFSSAICSSSDEASACLGKIRKVAHPVASLVERSDGRGGPKDNRRHQLGGGGAEDGQEADHEAGPAPVTIPHLRLLQRGEDRGEEHGLAAELEVRLVLEDGRVVLSSLRL